MRRAERNFSNEQKQKWKNKQKTDKNVTTHQHTHRTALHTKMSAAFDIQNSYK